MKEKQVAKAIITAGAAIAACIAFLSFSDWTGAFAAEAPVHRKIVCAPRPAIEIKAATAETKIEWRRERLDKAFKAGAKLPFIRSVTEFEQIKPKGLSKKEEAALKAETIRVKKAVKK